MYDIIYLYGHNIMYYHDIFVILCVYYGCVMTDMSYYDCMVDQNTVERVL